jgi:hypothetical protein
MVTLNGADRGRPAWRAAPQMGDASAKLEEGTPKQNKTWYQQHGMRMNKKGRKSNAPIVERTADDSAGRWRRRGRIALECQHEPGAQRLANGGRKISNAQRVNDRHGDFSIVRAEWWRDSCRDSESRIRGIDKRKGRPCGVGRAGHVRIGKRKDAVGRVRAKKAGPQSGHGLESQRNHAAVRISDEACGE